MSRVSNQITMLIRLHAHDTRLFLFNSDGFFNQKHKPNQRISTKHILIKRFRVRDSKSLFRDSALCFIASVVDDSSPKANYNIHVRNG